MGWAIILTLIATTITILGFVYGFLRNFKSDINIRLDKMENRMDKTDRKIDFIEERMTNRIDLIEERVANRLEVLEERIFWIATGKKLQDAILEEKIKRRMKI